MVEIFSLFIKCLFALFLILPFFYVLFIEEKIKQLKEAEQEPDPVLITEAEQEPQKEEAVLPDLTDKISFACWSVESKQTSIKEFR